MCSRDSKSSTLMADCLSYMQTDPYAIDIFHPRHVEKSHRLRTGYDEFKKRQEKPPRSKFNLCN